MALFRVRSASSTLFNKFVYSTSRSFCAAAKESETVAVNYIYAAQNMRPGTMIYNIENKPNQGGRFDAAQTTTGQSTREKIMSQLLTQDINSQIGSCMPLSMMRIGTMIHNIEMKPNQGGKLVRSAGTSAKILKEPTSDYVLVRLPSGNEKLIDTRCRATIGTVSNPSHKAKKLRKAGQARWLGRRPVVRGVAMNPVDHPHGGGEGRSKSSGCKGRTSLTPWGKPCKGGYKTGPLKRRK